VVSVSARSFEPLGSKIARDGLRELVVVGHSAGGMVIQGLHEAEPERICRLVFVDALVLRDGESAFDVIPPESVAGLRLAAADSPDGSVPMPPDRWRAGMMNAVDVDEADRQLGPSGPHPEGLFSQPISLPTFATAQVPTSFVFRERRSLHGSSTKRRPRD
jgi:pimeloyl-ACP methyl ester carboxylesterase